MLELTAMWMARLLHFSNCEAHYHTMGEVKFH